MNHAYLHINGNIIFKKYPIDPSDFTKRVWNNLDITDRSQAWKLLIEALALNADRETIHRLSIKWGCTLEDSVEFICRNLTPTEEQVIGFDLFLKLILQVDPDTYWDFLAAVPKGTKPDFKLLRRLLNDNH